MTSPAKANLDVDVNVEHSEGGQVQLAVTVPATPVLAARKRVIKAFGRSANIPGFRKGKAPLSVLEDHIDQDALKAQVIDDLLEDAYDAALDKAGIKPLDRARIADADLTDDGALTFSATVTLRPDIDLGDYKGLKATRRITSVTDTHVQSELERLRSRLADFRDLDPEADIEKNDVVVVDYELFVDGEKREDASASGYPFEVGSDQLFPELNDALPGAHLGQTLDVDVTYPDDHSDQSLAGKTGNFKVTVREARRRRLPDLDDDLAKRISDLDTLEALRGRIRENLEAMGKALAEQDARDDLVRQVSDASSLDVPDVVVGREVDRRVDQITEELQRRGLTLDQHLQNVGRSFADWRADIEAEARQLARRALVLDEIGERETIKVEEPELREEIRRQAEREGISEQDFQERLSESAEINRLVTRIFQRKVVDCLVENADITEETVEPEAEAEEQPPESPAPQPDPQDGPQAAPEQKT